MLFEVAGNGHNDAVVIMFMLAAIFFWVRARRVAVLPALLAGALTKFVPVACARGIGGAVAGQVGESTKDHEVNAFFGDSELCLLR